MTQRGLPLPFPASVHNAVMLAWTGQLEEPTTRCWPPAPLRRERRRETDLLAFHTLSSRSGEGTSPKPARFAADAMERARQLGGDVPMFMA